jgi:putative holliday junction resolvase
MLVLAIDPGQRRVGVALSDAGGRMAFPYQVLEVGGLEQAIGPLLRIIEREGAQQLVVGLPLNMDGTTGPAARRVIAWAQRLRQQAHLPLVFVDERLSSFEAEQQLARRRQAGEKLTRRRKKQQQDALAAAAILRTYLEGDGTIDVDEADRE